MTTKDKLLYFAAHLGSQVTYPNIEGNGTITAKLISVSYTAGLETAYESDQDKSGGDVLSWFSVDGNKCNALNTKLVLHPVDNMPPEMMAKCFAIINPDAAKQAQDIHILKKYVMGYLSHYMVYKSTKHRDTFSVVDPIVWAKLEHLLRKEDFAIGWGPYSVDKLIDSGVLKILG